MGNQQLVDVRGIGPATAKRLVEAGVTTVGEVAASAVEKLSAISGFPLSRSQSILAAARELVGGTAPVADPPAKATQTEAKKPKKKKAEKKMKKTKKKPKKKGKKAEKKTKKKPKKKTKKKGKKKGK